MSRLWIRYLVFALLLVGCASTTRQCSGCTAETFGADWVVVQVDLNGHPFRCWELRGASITNEPQSDGIYWQDPRSRNLVHISGLYNRVQVLDGRWDEAFGALGISRATCAAIRGRTE